MRTVRQSAPRFAAFLLLAAATALPLSAVLSSHVSNVCSRSSHSAIVAEGTMPPPPPTPKKSLSL